MRYHWGWLDWRTSALFEEGTERSVYAATVSMKDSADDPAVTYVVEGNVLEGEFETAEEAIEAVEQGVWGRGDAMIDLV